jgi:hypothetical protein
MINVVRICISMHYSCIPVNRATGVLRSSRTSPAVIRTGGVKHDAHNTGARPLRLIGVYVVEKGKPLATPAP